MRPWANENRALADIAASITVDQSMRTTLDTISRSVVGASRAVACAVFLMNTGEDRIEAAGGEGIPRPLLDAIEASIPASRAFAAETIGDDHSIFSPAARARMVADPAFASIAPMVENMNWESVLVLPIKYRGQPIGTINAAFPASVVPAAHEEAILQAIANQAAIAVQNARLYGQAQELAAVEERQRLARELHDSISQALYGVALGARTARTLLDRDPVKAIEPVEYVLSLAEAGLAEMRALIFELRPESLAMEGIVAAIEKQVASTQARYGVQVEAHVCAEPDVAFAIKEAFYRVAQEALHNVVKHARATHATLALTFEAGILRLDLEDDGQGFDSGGEFPGHLGLRSMRERITRVGGEFEVRSQPGTGARIRAVVDCVSPAPT